MNRFEQLLREVKSTGRIVVLDGAMGTQLQEAGLPPGLAPEKWNLEQPEVVRDIHRAYIEAGADAVETNSFGANRIKLAEYGLEDRVHELNYRAATLAHEAVGSRGFVVGSVGPLGSLMEPLGDVSFDEAYRWFAEQVQALARAGVDALSIETMGDLAELRVAVCAAVNEADVPVLAHMTYTAEGRTYTGTPPEAAAAVLESLGAATVGANCSVGPRELYPVMKELVSFSTELVSVMPNAGLPELVDGKTVFPMGPEEFASWGVRLAEAGVGVIGGCCGTTPEHIRRLAAAVRAASRSSSCSEAGRGRESSGRPLTLASRTEAVVFNREDRPLLIGERINPTSRKSLARDIESGELQLVRREARTQVNAGVHMLDINVGIPHIDQARAMEQAVGEVQSVVSAPLVLDSTETAVFEHGLKKVVGKPLINSVTAEPERMEQQLPLVRKYGAGVIMLAMDDQGVPETAEGRVAALKRIVSAAEKIGVRRDDMLLDVLCLTVGAQQRGAYETLRAVRLAKREFELPVMLGLGNVSYGMPVRSFIDSIYLAMAAANGLDVTIVDPLDEQVMNTVRAVRMFLNLDRNASEFLDAVQDTGFGGFARADGSRDTQHLPAELDAPPAAAPAERQLYRAVLEGNQAAVPSLVEAVVEEGVPPLELLEDTLMNGMERVGELYEEGTYYLPQLMQSAEAMKLAVQQLAPLLEEQTGMSRGTIVLATVEGDMHDIGKNIVTLLLENYGFEVIDMGRDVAAAEIVHRAKEVAADLVGLSALMTTTMPRMKEVVQKLRGAGLTMPIMVGGAATTSEFAEHIGADGHGRNAQEAVKMAVQLIESEQTDQGCDGR